MSKYKKQFSITLFRLFALVYLLFCVVFQLSSPTIASFNDTEIVHGTVSTAITFDNDLQEPDKSSEVERDTSQTSGKEIKNRTIKKQITTA